MIAIGVLLIGIVYVAIKVEPIGGYPELVHAALGLAVLVGLGLLAFQFFTLMWRYLP